MGRIAPSSTAAMSDRAFALRAAGKDIISLSVGEPDFATPAHVIAAAKAALDAGDTKYTAVAGTAALRKAAALHFARDLGINVPPEQVIVSAGGKQAIFHALVATLDPGDEVLIPCPWWVSYPEIVRFAGGTVVPLETTPAGGYRITPQQLAAAIIAGRYDYETQRSDVHARSCRKILRICRVLQGQRGTGQARRSEERRVGKECA